MVTMCQWEGKCLLSLATDRPSRLRRRGSLRFLARAGDISVPGEEPPSSSRGLAQRYGSWKGITHFGLSTMHEAFGPLAALIVFRSYPRTFHSGSIRYRNQQAPPRQNRTASYALSQNIRDNSA